MIEARMRQYAPLYSWFFPVLLLLFGCEAEQAVPATGEAVSASSATADSSVDVSKEPLAKDLFGKVSTLPDVQHPHWVWIYDMAADSMPDGRNYIIAYNDCCGKSTCNRCMCNRNEGDLPNYFPAKSNDINWCMGSSNNVYHCTTTILLGLAVK